MCLIREAARVERFRGGTERISFSGGPTADRGLLNKNRHRVARSFGDGDLFLSLAPEDLRPSILIRWRRYLAEHAVANDPVFGLWHDLIQGEPNPNEIQTDIDATVVAAVFEKWSSVPPGTAVGECNPLVLAALRAANPHTRAEVAGAYGDLFVKICGESKQPPETNVEATTAAGGPRSDVSSRSFSADGNHREAEVGELEAAARRQVLDLITSTNSPCYIPLSQTYRHMSRAESDQYWAKLGELDVMAATLPSACPRAMVVYDKPEPVEPRIFLRGNPSQLGRPVARQFVAIATPDERQPFASGSGRLELARAITAPDNPLTARVIVNRVWMYHFGEPLVSTPNDFGRRSTPPTHPELLDHLATQFMRDGWSLKKLHRRIMLSRAYQMSSTPGNELISEAAAVDPENQLLWRMNAQRLDFEAMRDTLLSVAGRLQQRNGGRPVDIVSDPSSSCRTLYGLVDRQSLPAVFRIRFRQPRSVDRAAAADDDAPTGVVRAQFPVRGSPSAGDHSANGSRQRFGPSR